MSAGPYRAPQTQAPLTAEERKRREEWERWKAGGHEPPGRGRETNSRLFRVPPWIARTMLDAVFGPGAPMPRIKDGGVSVTTSPCPRCGCRDAFLSMGTEIELACVPHMCSHGVECLYMHFREGEAEPCDTCIAEWKPPPPKDDEDEWCK